MSIFRRFPIGNKDQTCYVRPLLLYKSYLRSSTVSINLRTNIINCFSCKGGLHEASKPSHVNDTPLSHETTKDLSSQTDGQLFRDQNDTWVDRHAPLWLQPYLKLTRIDRPIGTYLVLLPGLWGLALAAPAGGLPDPAYAALFTAGAFLMRSAGCTINDIWDRDFDGKVARTAQRPLAAGRLGLLQAWSFLGLQLSAGLGILLQLNWYTIGLGCAIVPVVIAYPLLKRVTHWPQAVLGLAMNYGVVMGWGATHGSIDPSAVLSMYAGAVSWTIVYDTIYAHQDKVDDARLGLRSTALYMGGRSKAILTGFSLFTGAAWTATGLFTGLAWPYFAAVAASSGHMLWQARTADYSDRMSLARRFVSNQWVGWVMLAGIVAGKLLQIELADDVSGTNAAAVVATVGNAPES